MNETKILNFNHYEIKRVIDKITNGLTEQQEIINACYLFVRDEIKFGYNESDDIPASKVLNDGYGQCNTKSNLLLALLRGAGIEARFHGFTIDKRLQYGAVTGIFYWLTPKEIFHSWIEVNFNGSWYNLEGFILDKEYLSSLKSYFTSNPKTLCGYGVASDDFQSPQVEWSGNNNTYIQKEGIVKDLGIFDSPDEFYEKYGTNPKGLKKVLFKLLVRHIMNNTISKLRKKKTQSNGDLRTLCSIEDINSISFNNK